MRKFLNAFMSLLMVIVMTNVGYGANVSQIDKNPVFDEHVVSVEVADYTTSNYDFTLANTVADYTSYRRVDLINYNNLYVNANCNKVEGKHYYTYLCSRLYYSIYNNSTITATKSSRLPIYWPRRN